MIKCICIDDKNRPSKIPESKWVKEGVEYSLLFALIVSPQRQLAVQLAEINLDKSCAPFEYFLADRFAFNLEDLSELEDFIRECTDITMSVKELMKQTNINERATDTSQEN